MIPDLAGFDRARFLNSASEEEQFFSERGLTCIGVTDNTKGSALRYFLFQAHRILLTAAKVTKMSASHSSQKTRATPYSGDHTTTDQHCPLQIFLESL
jgi:hypothetical protein